MDAGDDNLTFIDPATRSSAGRARGCQASGSRILTIGIMKAGLRPRVRKGSNL